jgi:hypothetical protein
MKVPSVSCSSLCDLAFFCFSCPMCLTQTEGVVQPWLPNTTLTLICQDPFAFAPAVWFLSVLPHPVLLPHTCVELDAFIRFRVKNDRKQHKRLKQNRLFLVLYSWNAQVRSVRAGLLQALQWPGLLLYGLCHAQLGASTLVSRLPAVAQTVASAFLLARRGKKLAIFF